MRGALMIGLVVVLLIIGIMVMKNMGTNTSDGVSETQAGNYIERAEDTAADVGARVEDMRKRMNGSD